MAFYIPTGDPDILEATVHTAGPWGPEAQHGGPPSALLVRAMERLDSSVPGPSRLARITVDILGPVPVAPVRVSATVSRPGRSVELLDAELSAGGRAFMRARAWRIRTAAVDLPGDGLGAAPPPPAFPDEDGHHGGGLGGGFVRAMRWRPVSGGFDSVGPAVVWACRSMPLVAGEEPSGTQRLMLLADCGNGLSRVYDIASHVFINTDLTVHLHREPVGEWLCIEASTTVDPGGVGLAASRLFDAAGQVGRGAQALLITARGRT
ncbi:hypothetical protein Val02_52690 [Virgisporangium aliadipatigenens]|uniref:Thioesterase family protein n=1 Tax=Virgisporangium aliadipatigenens TaxID=741659 RepID=A0A8J3YRE4_9ACTN|nr:thioesterase family protein [Virgisporangium aliadipatigenens]GIJ48383.1 hypothetical protein Val02_52690 [Virgisporangium aliadipatigenens]